MKFARKGDYDYQLPSDLITKGVHRIITS